VARSARPARFPPGKTNEPEVAMTKLTFTVSEVAELLGICRTSAYECVRRGEIPALILGRRILVTRAALEQLLGPMPESLEPSLATRRDSYRAHSRIDVSRRDPQRDPASDKRQ
jgi:excisionase family DNA binding protein